MTTFDADASPLSRPELYAVRGTVSGLEGAKATLVMNGTTIVVADGPFAFPATLGQGIHFQVTVTDPTTHACTVSHGQGTVSGADVIGVVVTCLSRDASLKDLVLSSGPLSPAFGASTRAYSARARVPSVLLPATTAITATATHAGARILIGGMEVPSGTASPAMTLGNSPNPIAIDVTAPDGKTQAHYGVVVSVDVNDYIKASNPQVNAYFGGAVALSGDTLAVGAAWESSNAKGINGDQNDTSAARSGAVYIYVRTGATWAQQAYIKASDAHAGAQFASSLALEGDTLAVGCFGGSAYVFVRSGTAWSEQARLTPIGPAGAFGSAIALSGDTLAVGSRPAAAYLFTRSGTSWSQQAYVQSSNVRGGDGFGFAVALSGNTLAVGAESDSSAAQGINGDPSDTSMPNAGAAYVFTRSGAAWAQQAYVKASNTRGGAYFGNAIALSGDTLAVGSYFESSLAHSINGDQSGSTYTGVGAAYVFVRSGNVWSQQAYVKSSSGGQGWFGQALALDNDMLAVGADLDGTGAAYVFTRAHDVWTQRARVNASIPAQARFGCSVALSGGTLGVGGFLEPGGSPGINGDQANRSTTGAGAAYVF